MEVGLREAGYDCEDQNTGSSGALGGRLGFRWSIGQLMGLVAFAAVVFWLAAKFEVLSLVALGVTVLLAGPVIGSWMGWCRGQDKIQAAQFGAMLGTAIPWTLGTGFGAFLTALNGGLVNLEGVGFLLSLCFMGCMISVVVGCLIGSIVGIILEMATRNADHREPQPTGAQGDIGG
jgi:hypothetical protein